MSDHDEQVTSSQWGFLDAGSAVARARPPAAQPLSQTDRLPPADERETVPASLYGVDSPSSRRASGVGAAGAAKGFPPDEAPTIAGALDPADMLGEAAFASIPPEDLVSTKDKILAAILALLARHDASRLSLANFASYTLYRNAVGASAAGKTHAMQILLAISRIQGVSPKYLIMACEPPLALDIVSGRYVMSVLGNGMHSHHVSPYVVRMLARALTKFWSDCHLDTREQAAKFLPVQTAHLYF